MGGVVSGFQQKKARKKSKKARNALGMALEVTKEALDGFPIPGPKAAVRALLVLVDALEVSCIRFV